MGSIRHSAVAALLTSALLGGVTPAFADPATDARAALADGDRAAKAKDWATAARFFDAANKTAPSSDALEGLANAHYAAGHAGEAYTAYNEWLGRYGGKAPAAKRTTAETRLRELEQKTGALNVVVSEPGATISVDERVAGTSPLGAPLRLAVGARHVKVTKDGFAPFEQTIAVSANGAAALTAALTTTATKGKVVVREQNGKAVRVLVDGVDVGDAPWTGELEPGAHTIGVRGPGLVAAPQQVTVERGHTAELALQASTSSAAVKIGTSDGKGILYLDGKVVGEGTFNAEIPSGPHKLRITREGYDPFEEEILVKPNEPYSRTITLAISSAITTGPMQEIERFEGLYGGFTLSGFFTPGGTGSTIQNDCENKDKIATLASCTAHDGLGGGLGGYIGYNWDPVGLEFYGAFQYDVRTLQNDYNAASTDPGFGPDPARYEAYVIRRLGVLGAARVRGQWNLKKVRLSLAAGAGIDYRAMHLARRTTSKTGEVNHDSFSSDTTGYWSPVISIEPSVSYRVGKKLALQAGVQLLFDAPATFLNGNHNPSTAAEANHALGLRGLATPSYELASDMQVYVGPFLGMQFGP